MFIIPSIISVIVLLVCDLIWITTQKPMYASLVYNIQKTPMAINMPSAFMAYALMIVGFIFIVLHQVIVKRGEKILSMVWKALRYGGLFGFVVYGIFNATNYAMFNKKYNLKTGIIDTLWGTFGYTFATFVYLLCCAKING